MTISMATRKLGTLHLLCGKMASGKTTFSHQIAAQYQALRLSEDEWLAECFPGDVKTIKDYVDYSDRIKPLVAALVTQSLRSGIDVVMDFPANTPQQRAWLLGLAQACQASHQLYWMITSDQECLHRLSIRRAEQPDRRRFDVPEMFETMSAYFTAPTADESKNITTVDPSLAEHFFELTVTMEKIEPSTIPTDLLLIADPNIESIQSYQETGFGFVAIAHQRGERNIVAACVVSAHSSELGELMNISVRPDFQQQGIGRRLLDFVIEQAKIREWKTLNFTTGTFGYPLTLYQRAGFRVTEVRKNYFIDHYRDAIFEHGIQHQDSLLLSLDLTSFDTSITR